MRFAGVACGTVFLGLALPAWTQDITSQIVVTGRSLAVEPATNNFAAPGGVTTFLTTYDGGNGQPLFPFSGEAKPMFLGSSNYVTDYEGHLGILDPTGSLVNYGEMVISNMPVGIDSDGDGLPDFLEKNLSSTFTVDATDREDWRFDGNTNNSEWTLSFSRFANDYQGSYTLRKKTDPNNPDKIWNGNFQLKGGTGTVTFATNTRTFSFSTASFDTIYPESNSGAGTYGVTTSGQILASGFWMNSSFGPAHRVYINPFLIQRIGTSERGRAVLYAADGHPPANASSTAYPDYTEFHLEVTNLPASLTQTPNSSSTLPWNDDFSSTNSSANYLDFRYSHFAQFEIADGRLNLVANANPYGGNYGNLSIYSPPHLLLPLNSSWDISFQVSLPAPTADTYYQGVGVSLAPENDAYDIANFGATLYSFELGQENWPQVETFLATYARKDWVEDSALGLVTPVNFTSAFLRFSYNSATKVLSTYYDSNVSSPTRTWTSYDELNLDPADPTSAAADIGLTSNSRIRMALWADAYRSDGLATENIWLDNFSVTGSFAGTAPAISSSGQPLSTLASVGQPVSFSVIATGTDPLTYQWRLNCVNIPGANTATYTIPAADTSHAGSYAVVVSNAAGSATSSLASLALTTSTISSFSYPGARSTYGSDAYGPQLVGYFEGYPDSNGDVERKGFLFQNGSWTLLHPPGALKSAARGISSSGPIVGFFQDSASNDHGYVYKNGNFISLDYPSASQTRIFGVDASDDSRLVGSFTDNQGVTWGFLKTSQGWTPLMAPSAVETRAYGVAGSWVVGKYRLVPDGAEYGFLWDGTHWASLGEGRLPYAVTPEGYAIGEHRAPWVTSGLATFFLYQNGLFWTLSLPGSEAAIPYGYDPSNQRVSGFYLRQDQSGWNSFTPANLVASLPAPPADQRPAGKSRPSFFLHA